LSEFHTVGTDTEKAHDANVEVTAGFEKRWADNDLSCRIGWWSETRFCRYDGIA